MRSIQSKWAHQIFIINFQAAADWFRHIEFSYTQCVQISIHSHYKWWFHIFLSTTWNVTPFGVFYFLSFLLHSNYIGSVGRVIYVVIKISKHLLLKTFFFCILSLFAIFNWRTPFMVRNSVWTKIKVSKMSRKHRAERSKDRRPFFYCCTIVFSQMKDTWRIVASINDRMWMKWKCGCHKTINDFWLWNVMPVAGLPASHFIYYYCWLVFA